MLWGTDATMAYTQNDGWVWVFACVEHFTAEGWVSVEVGEPVPAFGQAHLRRGVALRHDWGPQYTSGHFQGALAKAGHRRFPAFAGEPPCNGCAERFIRTLKEQVIWGRIYTTIDELREAIAAFIDLYNDQCLIERHGHRTPREVYNPDPDGGSGMKPAAV